MKLNNTVVTLALLGVLALAALAGGCFLAGNAVHAADPGFVSDAADRSLPENTPPGVNIGAPISATDSDETGDVTPATEFGNTLTYKLGHWHGRGVVRHRPFDRAAHHEGPAGLRESAGRNQ